MRISWISSQSDGYLHWYTSFFTVPYKKNRTCSVWRTNRKLCLSPAPCPLKFKFKYFKNQISKFKYIFKQLFKKFRCFSYRQIITENGKKKRGEFYRQFLSIFKIVFSIHFFFFLLKIKVKQFFLKLPQTYKVQPFVSKALLNSFKKYPCWKIMLPRDVISLNSLYGRREKFPFVYKNLC